MTDQLYQVGDQVRASHVGSKILEAAVVEEVREKFIGYSRRVKPKPKTGRPSYKIVGPMYWVRFVYDGHCVARWQNELVPQPALELKT